MSLAPFAGRKGYRSRINREQSRWRMKLLPPVTVLAGSAMPLILPILPDEPVLPPLGLMMFLAWGLLRPTLWPLWAGALFGLFDDVMSGQPIGTAALIWSAITMFVHVLERRMVWRNYQQDWLIAGIAIIFAIVAGWCITGLVYSRPAFTVLIPQMVFSILVFPFLVSLTAILDRWRLAR